MGTLVKPLEPVATLAHTARGSSTKVLPATSAVDAVGVQPLAHRGQTSGHHVGDDSLGNGATGDVTVGVGTSLPEPDLGGASEGVEGDLAGSVRVGGVEAENLVSLLCSL